MVALWCGTECEDGFEDGCSVCKGWEEVWFCDHLSHWRREPAVGLETLEKSPLGGSLRGSGPE